MSDSCARCGHWAHTDVGCLVAYRPEQPIRRWHPGCGCALPELSSEQARAEAVRDFLADPATRRRLRALDWGLVTSAWARAASSRWRDRALEQLVETVLDALAEPKP